MTVNQMSRRAQTIWDAGDQFEYDCVTPGVFRDRRGNIRLNSDHDYRCVGLSITHWPLEGAGNLWLRHAEFDRCTHHDQPILVSEASGEAWHVERVAHIGLDYDHCYGVFPCDGERQTDSKEGEA